MDITCLAFLCVGEGEKKKKKGFHWLILLQKRGPGRKKGNDAWIFLFSPYSLQGTTRRKRERAARPDRFLPTGKRRRWPTAREKKPVKNIALLVAVPNPSKREHVTRGAKKKRGVGGGCMAPSTDAQEKKKEREE